MHRNAFSDYHPAINFLYFALVLLFGMCFMHPACLAISFFSALLYSWLLNGGRTLVGTLKFVAPIVLLAMVLNPVFNHQGVTILRYLPSGNPLTLESILYGIAAAVMLGGIILWFSCFNKVMTTDKFVYLFGRVIPALSLVLSMTLRFIPRFRDHMKVVSSAQQCVGRNVTDGNLLQKAKHGITILSIMVTWSLENAIETADSMKCRGYGLPGRSSFSIYRFDDRDKGMLIWLLFCGVFIIAGWIAGGMHFDYYPMVSEFDFSVWSVSFKAVYLALCLTPVLVEVKETLVWKRLKSEI